MPVEQPLAIVAVDGVPVGGLVSLNLRSPSGFNAGRFEAVFAMGQAPCWPLAAFAGLGQNPVTVAAAPDGLGYATLFTGQVEQIRIDLAANTATLQGRDMTALFIDAELSQSFVNQTASEVALTLAAGHGLAANVTPTSTPVGQYYQLDHARTALHVGSRSTTEWNLLCRLAQIEGFGVSVQGQTLNFGPVTGSPAMYVTPANFIQLDVDIVTALPACVVVSSWDSRGKQVVQQTLGSGTTANLVRPNLTPAQAQNAAATYLAALQQHQQVLSGQMPADVTLAPGYGLVLSGTESDLDGAYVVTAVNRRLSGRDGFVQFVRAYLAGG